MFTYMRDYDLTAFADLWIDNTLKTFDKCTFLEKQLYIWHVQLQSER